MIRSLLTLLALVVCVGCSNTSSESTPSVVLTGFEAYRTKGLQAGYEIWSKGTLETDPVSREAVVGGLTRVEGVYGRLTSHAILKCVRVGPSVRRVYAVAHFEKGPVYGHFDCYKVGDQWIITDIMFHTKANIVFPPSLLGG